MASRINADPVCDDCEVRRAVEDAPDECNHCSEYPVAFVKNGSSPLYLCRDHADAEHPENVFHFRDFGSAGGDE